MSNLNPSAANAVSPYTGPQFRGVTGGGWAKLTNRALFLPYSGPKQEVSTEEYSFLSSENLFAMEKDSTHTDVEELPWIEDFAFETSSSDEEEIVDEFREPEPENDTWVLEKAGDEFNEILDSLPTHSEARDQIDAVREEHTEWQDDESWFDIMPTSGVEEATGREDDLSWARAFSEPPADMPAESFPTLNEEAAAASLEAVARKLRSGELALTGYSAEKSEAAALAAALAAILGSVN